VHAREPSFRDSLDADFLSLFRNRNQTEGKNATNISNSDSVKDKSKSVERLIYTSLGDIII
jgi:hypothetical protein